MRQSKVLPALATLGLMVSSLLGAQAAQPPSEIHVPRGQAIEDWWKGTYGSGNWLGARDTLENEGLTLRVEWKSISLWNVDGGIQERFGYNDEWKFTGNIDFAELTGWSALEGLSLFSAVRYRNGTGVNKWVGSAYFAPSSIGGGRYWRFQTVYLTYVTPELFGTKEFLTISGGWQTPSAHFITQPNAKFFVNDTFTSGSLFANGIPWSGSYSAWGGYLKVKPVDWFYAQGGMYLAIPFATSISNHGLNFAGYRIDPNLNGLYFLAETGFTPAFGPAKLGGRYVSGLIYFGVENQSFFGQPSEGRFAFYWQVDQMLYREPTREPIPRVEPHDIGEVGFAGEDAPEVVEPPKLRDQGLYFFSLLEFAPKYNNTMPFYCQAGFVYKGLIPGREEDQTGIGFAYGNYSFDKQIADEKQGLTPLVYEAALEFGYRIQVNPWSYAQPVIQYIIRPSGTGLIENATVIGFRLGAIF